MRLEIESREISRAVKMLIRTSVIVVCIVLFALSCKTSELIDYVHGDTALFPQKLNIHDAQLTQYIVNDVLFVPYIKRVDFENSRIRIGLYSAVEGKNVLFSKVVLSRADGVPLEKEIKSERLLSEKVEGADLYHAKQPVFDPIKQSDLETLSKGSDLLLTLYVTIRDGEKEGLQEINFKLRRYARTYVIQR
jgi:hypothetical protein